MTAKSAIDIEGFEYDWLASDAEGHVALFTTAGAGYAPEEFLRDTDAHAAAIDAILARPRSTTARFAPKLRDGVENTWLRMAERGLFAYDSNANGGPYHLRAAPVVPIRAADLPAPAAEVVGLVKLDHMTFVNQSLVTDNLLKQRRRGGAESSGRLNES